MDKNYALAFFCFLTTLSVAQGVERRTLKGKATANANSLSELFVINRETEETVKSDGYGAFSILAKPGDTLVFTAMQFAVRELVVTHSNFDSEFSVALEPAAEELDEVLITQQRKIDAVSLRILSAPAKKYTPAQRKLKTAGDFKPIDLIKIIGGGMEADPIINAITGRTAMLKKELAIEKKEYYLQLLSTLFSDRHYIDKLKIPELYVNGFRYFLVENDKFTAALQTKNKTMADFMMAGLAVNYLELIKSEPK